MVVKVYFYWMPVNCHNTSSSWRDSESTPKRAGKWKQRLNKEEQACQEIP
jgi:hypothetical protein